jgi:DNA-binding CsgD family transcriptional regulator
MSSENNEIAYLRQLAARFRKLASRDPAVSAELNEIADQVSARADRLQQAAKAIHWHNEVPPKERQPRSSLTPREREVLTWLARGKTSKDVGDILKIAKRTVEAHANSAIRKLKANNRAQAIAIAMRDRLLNSD